MRKKTETRTSFIIEVTPIFYPSSTPNRKEKQLLPKPPVGLQTTGSSDLNKKSFESHEQLFLVK